MYKTLSHIFQNTFIKTLTIVVTVLALSWGITQATINEFEQSTKNFSVIGTVSSITEDTISIIDARGSDTKTEDLYNLDITHLKTVETKDYVPLIISDVTIGSTIVAQGVTNDSIFFITRIVLFSETPFTSQEETLVATSTEEVLESDTATTTPIEEPSNESSSSDTSTPEAPIEETPATTTEPIIETPTEEVIIPEATTTPIIDTPPAPEETATTTVVDTVVDILEDGINNVSDFITSFSDTPQAELLPVE
jgi:hypothetical protein